MKKLTIFYLDGCPYCDAARRALSELRGEDPASDVPVEWIDERAHAALADRFDYYYVPAVFDGERKLYEAKPSHSYETIRDALRGTIREFRQREEP